MITQALATLRAKQDQIRAEMWRLHMLDERVDQAIIELQIEERAEQKAAEDKGGGDES